MTAPDTNTPRDGLTDAANELLYALSEEHGTENGHFESECPLCNAYDKLRSAIAADREARPAPARIQALADAAKREARHLFDLAEGAEDMAHLSMAIDRLAAASTPPAEAPGWRKLAHQFDGQRMAAMWHLKALLADPEGHAEKVREFIAATPDKQIASAQAASEARATGDAAAKALLGYYDDAQSALSKAMACGYNVTAALEAASAVREVVLAALSDRPTGDAADPTDPGRDVDTLREHVRHLERQVRELSARSTGAVPAGWRIDRSSCVDGDECFVISSDPMACGELVYRSRQPVVFKFLSACAATGAAGEPQPREVNK